MKYYCENKEAVLQQMNTSEKGLGQEDARQRLKENGKNRLKDNPGKPRLILSEK